MGRYKYNGTLVSNALDELNSAVSTLADVTTQIQSGISTINSATGSGCIDVDYSSLLTVQEIGEEVIEEDIRTIQEKVTTIEDYENAPWYKKLFSSAGMALTKFGEGIAKGFEEIGDGVVSITGFVGGIFSSDFKNSCAEYVAKDHVGDWFDKQYTSGALSGLEKYSFFGKDSTAANLFKGFGVAAPYIALSMTGAGIAVETTAAGISGIGSGTEAGIQKRLMGNPNMTAGDAFNQAFMTDGLWQGAKNAAIVYGMNKLSKTIQTRADTPRLTAKAGQSVDDAMGLTRTEKIFQGANKLGAKTGVNKVLQSGDDLLSSAAAKVGSTKAAQAIGRLTSPITTKAGKIFTKVASKPVVSKVTTAVGSTIAKHPGLAFTAAGTVFALDQVDEAEINTQYRKATDLGDVSGKPVDPTPSPTPTPKPTTTPVPSVTPTPSATPIVTPPPTQTAPPIPTTGPGGSSVVPTVTVTVTPVPTPSITPAPTPTVSTTLTPTPSVTPAPTPTATMPAPTQTPAPIITPDPTSTVAPTPTVTIPSELEIPDDSEINVDEPSNTEDNLSGSFTELIGGNQYTKIPTSSAPITTTKTTARKKSIIPVIAGLGAATIAGVGTKAYLDKQEESNTEEDFEAEEWDEEDFNSNNDYEYDAISDEEKDYLDPTDEYAYTEDGMGDSSDTEESYEAVNNSELASMQ